MPVKKKATKKVSKHTTSDGHSYLTERITVAKAQAAGKAAASKAMKLMGFVVAAEDDKIVKKFANGDKEIIAHL